MDVHFWHVKLTCLKCSSDVVLQACQFSSDGELKFTFYCFDCKQVWLYRVFASQLVSMALVNDVEEYVKSRNEPGRPVRPPLLTPPPLFTEEDKKLERDMGIDPDNGKEKS